MSRSLALCSDQSAVYRSDLGKVIVRRAGMPLRRKPRRQESALYLQLLVNSDIHLPIFRSADLHRRTTIATSGLRRNHRRSKRATACYRQLKLNFTDNPPITLRLTLEISGAPSAECR